MDMPAGATPEESQSDAMGTPPAEEQMGGAATTATTEAVPNSEQWITDEEIERLLGSMGDEESPAKPFGDQIITEDEAVNMDRK
jgi:hypothetical protein